MIYFTENAEARTALTRVLMDVGAAIPADVREQMIAKAADGGTAEIVSQLSELIYARRDELGDEVKQLGAQFAAYRAYYGFYRGEDGTNDRARGIQYALMLAIGEAVPAGVTFDAENLPAPLPIYAAPATVGGD